jgi:hypothetical protein
MLTRIASLGLMGLLLLAPAAMARTGNDVQAPRGEDIQALRNQDVQAPRDDRQDGQAPREAAAAATRF